MSDRRALISVLHTSGSREWAKEIDSISTFKITVGENISTSKTSDLSTKMRVTSNSRDGTVAVVVVASFGANLMPV